jgi:hypothetical protein
LAVRQGFAPIPDEPKASRDVTEDLANRPSRKGLAVRQGFEPWVGL